MSRYKKQLKKALNFSKKIGVQHILWDSINKESDENMHYAIQYIEKIIPIFLKDFRKNYPYVGNSCLDISANIFMFLKSQGFNVEMIFGDVNINNKDEFSTTEKYLASQYLNKIKDRTPQDLHAWVGIGDDFIIDFALPDRLHHQYGYPCNVLFGSARSDYYEQQLSIKYKPMLIGTNFFNVTNAYDPLIKAYELLMKKIEYYNLTNID